LNSIGFTQPNDKAGNTESPHKANKNSYVQERSKVFYVDGYGILCYNDELYNFNDNIVSVEYRSNVDGYKYNQNL